MSELRGGDPQLFIANCVSYEITKTLIIDTNNVHLKYRKASMLLLITLITALSA